MRPKSTATVVVVLSGSPAVSSSPVLDCVIASSVCRVGISDSVRIRVVLPTPKGPVTTSFIRVSAALGR